MLRIANASGFWGDRMSAVEEMVRGGPIDVLTGDYLAELTMALLHRRRMKDSSGGYVPSFYAQMERVLAECMAKKIRIVSNAGGLNPAALADKLAQLAARLGLAPKIAYVDGDDLLSRLSELRAAGEHFRHVDRASELDPAHAPVTANAYLGGWAITEALARGADIVVTGRVTDAALVVGPSAWHFGWKRDDYDRLAGAVAAGHVLECGPQATGGNYCFADEIPTLDRIGFPIAEMHEDGSFVVTKHPGTGGAVTVGTVTAQLLYEIQGARYLSPDVTARFDTLRVEEEAKDRVRVFGATGEPPPPTSKVCLNLFGGFRNNMTVVLGGLDIEDKAARLSNQLFTALGGRDQFTVADTSLVRGSHQDPATHDDALSTLTITVMSPEADRVGKHFSSQVVALALSSVSGITFAAPPKDASPYLIYWPTLVDAGHVCARLHLDGQTIVIPQPARTQRVVEDAGEDASPSPRAIDPDAPTRLEALGRLFGARSGDKGGNANLGVWARSDEAFAFLDALLTTDRLRALIPETATLPIRRTRFSHLRALNFVITGYLGDGVASCAKLDPQAKTLGEYLRAKVIPIPTALRTH